MVVSKGAVVVVRGGRTMEEIDRESGFFLACPIISRWGLLVPLIDFTGSMMVVGGMIRRVSLVLLEKN